MKQIPIDLTCSLDLLELENWQVIGRIVKKYEHRNVVLLAIQNNGINTSAVIKKGLTSCYEECRKNISLGDIVASKGDFVPGRNNKPELAITEVRIVKKTELSAEQSGLLPNNLYTGHKARHHYHTLMATDPTCVFLLEARSAMLHALQSALNAQGYICCSTPVLQHSFFAGGSRPFITHMLDNDADMFLRVTSEIALKHIVAGGLRKVYEIGNSFRNGSVSAMHNTPFMGAEIYQAYCSEMTHRKFAVSLIREIQRAVLPVMSAYSIPLVNDLSQEIPTYTFEEYIHLKGFSEFRLGNTSTYPELGDLGKFGADEVNNTKLLYKWFKNVLIKDQLHPVFVTSLPSGISPLIEKESQYTLHRSYLVVNGATLMEIAQSEVDSDIVLDELAAQQALRGSNAYPCDYTALAHAYQLGIPPMCSLFIGIDRFIPALMGADSINQYQMYL